MTGVQTCALPIFDEEIEEEDPDKDSAPTEIIEVKATEVDSSKLEDKKHE